MRAAIDATRKKIHVHTNVLQLKKEPRSGGAQAFDGTESYPALFAAGVLMLLVRRPLAGPWVALRGRLLRAALAAGRGLARAFVVLRRRMLLSCAALTAILAAGRGLFGALLMLRRRMLLSCAALTAILAAGRGLFGALLMLRRRLMLGCATLTAGRGLTCALVLLRGRLLRTCATLAGR